MIEERFSFDDAYEQHERGEILPSSYFAALRQSLGINLSDGDFIEGWNDVYLGPVPGMAEVLSIAQQFLPLFAFTNSNPSHKSVWEARLRERVETLSRHFRLVRSWAPKA